MEDKQIIEVGGTKIEIDFAQVRKIETFRIGDTIKIFKKKYSDWKIYPAIITGFAKSEEMSGIEITYLELDYSSARLMCDIVTEESKDIVLATISSTEKYMTFDNIPEMLARDIEKREMELAEAKSRLKFFNDFYEKLQQQTNEK